MAPWPPVANARSLLFTAVITAITIGGTFGSQAHQHPARRLDPLGVALLFVMCAALLVRRSRPAVAMLTVTACVAVYFSLAYSWGPVFVPLVIVVVTTVLAGYRLLAWSACALAYAFIIFGGYYLGGVGKRPGLAASAAAVAWPLVVLIGAEVLRSGRERAAGAARSRAEQARRRASEERLRIAQELHDVLAHNISLISVQAGVALHLMAERPDQATDQARTSLTAIKQASKEALTELRSVLGLLRASTDEQPPLSPVPGMAQLSDLTSRAVAAGLEVRTTIAGEPRELPVGTDLAAYRIVQESLTNVIRHAGASHVKVRVSYGETSLRIEIEDDGAGGRAAPGISAHAHGARPAARAAATSGAGPNGVATGMNGGQAAHGGGLSDRAGTSGVDGSGNGIPGMRERVRMLGGELTAGPQGRGFLVRARLPIERGDRVDRGNRGDGSYPASGAGTGSAAGKGTGAAGAASDAGPAADGAGRTT
jgi:signal transduction histidine kinase